MAPLAACALSLTLELLPVGAPFEVLPTGMDKRKSAEKGEAYGKQYGKPFDKPLDSFDKPPYPFGKPPTPFFPFFSRTLFFCTA